MTAYFIAATGTGVGKTFTTCALLHAARQRGAVMRGLKPVISGWDAADATSDTAQIIVASGMTGEVAKISPWRFAAPLSPHRAAALEQKTLDMGSLTDWTNEQIRHTPRTLVEGVGGVMVPLNDRDTTLDWMVALGLPVILVVGSYLGTISHTLTALSVVRARGIRVRALVMNESAESSVAWQEAQAGLAPFIADMHIVFQPRVTSWKEATAIHVLESQL
jgi:dethiobiotin synthetase